MSTEDVSFAYPRELLRALEEKMLSPLGDALASPPDAAASLETIDDVSFLLDMMMSLAGRAHALLKVPADASERAEISEGIRRAWKGVCKLREIFKVMPDADEATALK